ncbi:isoprenyl transferase [Serpentinicella sp. ANB-PHB4]|uniref:isoprenyl transferase n=1 Tax=Serpentinicella sp. ANB-PHB4 TaxID=3074076 RepID=UPI002F3FA181
MINKTDNLNNNNNQNVPNHIAIIMDGNGRWANQRNIPRSLGHRAGVEALKNIVKKSADIGIKYLTLFAFSTENWNRPEKEVSALMKLLKEFLKKESIRLHKNGVKITVIGDITLFSDELINQITKVEEMTKMNKKLTLSIALNYGGRNEITRAVKKIIENNYKVEDIDEHIINQNLDTKGIPDPDLLIRTSGEYRLSNFLLWQCAYTEFWFTDILWPDFTPMDLENAIKGYQNRERRFGSVK